MMNTPTTAQKVGRLAVTFPWASRIFDRHGIDFCCGGNQTLAEACTRVGIGPERVLEEILQESERNANDHIRWDERPLGELVDFLVTRYHEPLREELPRLRKMASKVLRVHGEKDPERLSALADVVHALSDDLMTHMHKEERVLFPWVRAGNGATAGAPIRVLLSEHESAAEMLQELRVLTNDFVPPKGACATWRALWLGLSDLDRELRQHVHLENNVLFPRALAG